MDYFSTNFTGKILYENKVRRLIPSFSILLIKTWEDLEYYEEEIESENNDLQGTFLFILTQQLFFNRLLNINRGTVLLQNTFYCYHCESDLMCKVIGNCENNNIDKLPWTVNKNQSSIQRKKSINNMFLLLKMYILSINKVEDIRKTRSISGVKNSFIILGGIIFMCILAFFQMITDKNNFRL